MDISIVMPVYNRASLIGDTLESLMAQTYPAKEIIIVNDGSTDDTEAVLKQFEKWITWATIKNSGPGSARAHAIEMTSYPWIAPCDSDDLWMPNHLERRVELIRKFPEANFTFSNFSQFGEKGIQDFDKFASLPASFWQKIGSPDEDGFLHVGEGEYPNFLAYQPAFTTTLAFTRDLYKQVGGFREDVSWLASEDMHLTRRMIAYGNVAIDWERTVSIRKHTGNHSAEFLKVLIGEVDIFRKFIDDKEIPEAYFQATEDFLKGYPIQIFEASRYAEKFADAVKAARSVPRDDKSLKFYLKLLQCQLYAAMGKG